MQCHTVSKENWQNFWLLCPTGSSRGRSTLNQGCKEPRNPFGTSSTTPTGQTTSREEHLDTYMVERETRCMDDPSRTSLCRHCLQLLPAEEAQAYLEP